MSCDWEFDHSLNQSVGIEIYGIMGLQKIQIPVYIFICFEKLSIFTHVQIIQESLGCCLLISSFHSHLMTTLWVWTSCFLWKNLIVKILKSLTFHDQSICTLLRLGCSEVLQSFLVKLSCSISKFILKLPTLKCPLQRLQNSRQVLIFDLEDIITFQDLDDAFVTIEMDNLISETSSWNTDYDFLENLFSLKITFTIFHKICFLGIL